MAHEISINSVGQTEAVFGFNEKPWWGNADMPAVVLPGAVGFDQIFSIAFPWTALQEQLQYADGSLSGQHGIRRSDTLAELGVHSGNYGNIQPRDLFDFCAAFFQAYPEIPIASAIAMQGGAVLNISARLGEIDVLGSGDIHKSYLCFANSFNGKIKAQAYKSYVRPVCMNTTISGISSADFKMSYKHTKNVRARIQEDTNKATQLMMAQQATDDRVKEILETLAKRKLTRPVYEAILDDLFPGESTRTKNTKGVVSALFSDNDSNAFPDFKGTAYNMYNAVTNYVDHEKTVALRQGNTRTIGQQRFENATIGDGAAMKERALERILVLSDGSEEHNPIFSLPSTAYKHMEIPVDDSYHATVQSAPIGIVEASYDSPMGVFEDYDDDKDDAAHTDYNPLQDRIDTADERTKEKLSALLPEIVATTPAHEIDESEPLGPLYTTAPHNEDMAGTVLDHIVEVISDQVSMRRVLVPEHNLDTQRRVYKSAKCAVFTESEWLALHAGKND